MAGQQLPFYLACRVCGQPHQLRTMMPGTIAICVRCGSRLSRCTHSSLTRTFAFALAALLLYLPANLFPILHLDLYGSTSENTVWDGVIFFWRDGEQVMAAIVLMASIVIPVFKLTGLLFLVASTHWRMSRCRRLRTWLYDRPMGDARCIRAGDLGGGGETGSAWLGDAGTGAASIWMRRRADADGLDQF